MTQNAYSRPSTQQPLNLAELADLIARLRDRHGADAVLVRTEVMEAEVRDHGGQPELYLSLRI